MSWTLSFTATARREIRKLDPPVRRQIEKELEALAGSPFSGKLLQGRLRGAWSWRSGDYRILYGADPPGKTLVVYRVAHRREVYRD